MGTARGPTRKARRFDPGGRVVPFVDLSHDGIHCVSVNQRHGTPAESAAGHACTNDALAQAEVLEILDEEV